MLLTYSSRDINQKSLRIDLFDFFKANLVLTKENKNAIILYEIKKESREKENENRN